MRRVGSAGCARRPGPSPRSPSLCDREADPEAERKEIRNTSRLMRDNYERGLYEGEEFMYWQKVNALKEKLDLLNRINEWISD